MPPKELLPPKDAQGDKKEPFPPKKAGVIVFLDQAGEDADDELAILSARFGWPGQRRRRVVGARHFHASPSEDGDEPHLHAVQEYLAFAGRVGLNDTGEGNTYPITFSIFGDDNRLWASRPVQSRADAQEFSISVKGVTSLRIQVDITGDPKGAHAVWVEPRLER